MSRDSSSEGPNAAEFLSDTVTRFQDKFVAEKSILSFEEYLDVVAQNPRLQGRDAAGYIRDCFLHYGTEQVTRPYGRFTRYRLFDCEFDQGRDPLVAHENVQEEVFGLLSDFVRDGRVNRLILLNGPNGSAKSRLVSCVFRALEHYSHQDEGALFTFNWVFPTAKLEKTNIGFGGGRSLAGLETYAHLKERDIEARLMNETRDHPLLLLPASDRVQFLSDAHGGDGHLRLPKSLTEGELSPKGRDIYEALLKAYQGDLAEVLKHVQVERIFISRRYRTSAVTVDPQMRVDAGVRQVTADRSLSSLPPSLQNMTLYEPMGDLVDANRGMIEYNDLLKRPVEAFKYLLSTCETGAVRLDTMTLHLDSVFFATCNADHLSGFKQIPDFASFKARIELIQMPYLVDYTCEADIYRELIADISPQVAVGPHVAELIALWAVLCRVHNPISVKERPKDLKQALGKMSPLDKALLYATGKTAAGIGRDLSNSIKALVPSLHSEYSSGEDYEGRFGPSPRELKGLLLGALHKSETCLTGVGIIRALKELCEQASVYEFLRMESKGEYHHPLRAIEITRAWYLDRIEEELHMAMGLVDPLATTDLLLRYIDHVVHFVRREKWTNPLTGMEEEPSESLMNNVEKQLDIETSERPRFRESMVHRIAAWRMDNPDAELDYEVIFRDYLEQLNETYYDTNRRASARMIESLVKYLVDDSPRMDKETKKMATSTFKALQERFGYDKSIAIEVIGYLLRERPDLGN